MCARKQEKELIDAITNVIHTSFNAADRSGGGVHVSPARIKKDPIGANSSVLQVIPPWFETLQERLGNVRYRMRYAGMVNAEIDAMEADARQRAETVTTHFLDVLWNLFEEWKEKR